MWDRGNKEEDKNGLCKDLNGFVIKIDINDVKRIPPRYTINVFSH